MEALCLKRKYAELRIAVCQHRYDGLNRNKNNDKGAHVRI
jgi:hypothetical protein